MDGKLILYIACSLDGYIAKPNDDLSFLDRVSNENLDYGYNKFISTVDTVIIGRRTYDWIINQNVDFPHSDKATYVITRKRRKRNGKITFYSGDLKELVIKLKKEKGKNIFCDGGSEIANLLFADKLFDELIISIIPVIVGGGINLFKEGIPEQVLTLISVQSFKTGLVQLHYNLIK